MRTAAHVEPGIVGIGIARPIDRQLLVLGQFLRPFGLEALALGRPTVDQRLPDGGGVPGPDGADFVEDNGRVVDYAGAARRLELPALLREGEAGTLGVSGVPGDLVGVFVSATGLGLPLSGPTGTFVPGEPLVGPFVFGPLPAGGQVDLPFSVPTLPGVDGLVLLAQGYVLAQDGSERLTNPSALALVGAGF